MASAPAGWWLVRSGDNLRLNYLYTRQWHLHMLPHRVQKLEAWKRNGIKASGVSTRLLQCPHSFSSSSYRYSSTMKWFQSFVLAIQRSACLVLQASPLELVKRASPGEVANLGFATINGGKGQCLTVSLAERLVAPGGSTTTVSSLAALTSAVTGDAKKIVIISGLDSNTSIIGLKGSSLVGVGLRVYKASNVIIRNVKISKVLADAGDAIGVQEASKVWLDHLDPLQLTLTTTRTTTMACSTSPTESPRPPSATPSSTTTGREPSSATLTATALRTPRSPSPYVGNYFSNINSRTPSFRFGKGHIYNNFFENVNDGINTRKGAQLLVENNVFTGTKKPLYATDAGFAVARDNDFGGGANTAPAGSFTSPPYSYSKVATGSVRSSVTSSAGQTLTF
ncbi:pectate lyase B [Coprinopsis sp. MPI-PUGE-AT-0042]|nr:pectate lyase B [Coprinopsis sp. MPI-PUGE-AT-0042]